MLAALTLCSIVFCSRIGYGSGVVASFGVNRFIVKAPLIVQQDYPEAYKHTTLYGRVAGKERLINLNMQLNFDEEVRCCHFCATNRVCLVLCCPDCPRIVPGCIAAEGLRWILRSSRPRPLHPPGELIFVAPKFPYASLPHALAWSLCPGCGGLVLRRH